MSTTWIQVPEFNGAVDLSCKAPPGANLVCPCEEFLISVATKKHVQSYMESHLKHVARFKWLACFKITGTLPSKPLILRGLCQSSSIDSVYIPANDRWVKVKMKQSMVFTSPGFGPLWFFCTFLPENIILLERLDSWAILDLLLLSDGWRVCYHRHHWNH